MSKWYGVFVGDEEDLPPFIVSNTFSKALRKVDSYHLSNDRVSLHENVILFNGQISSYVIVKAKDDIEALKILKKTYPMWGFW